jgi:hypothetical protein
MHVTKFFDAFVFGPHVEIVEPFLPGVLREVVGLRIGEGALRLHIPFSPRFLPFFRP